MLEASRLIEPRRRQPVADMRYSGVGLHEDFPTNPATPMTRQLPWLLLGAVMLLACVANGTETKQNASIRVAGFMESAGIT